MLIIVLMHVFFDIENKFATNLSEDEDLALYHVPFY